LKYKCNIHKSNEGFNISEKEWVCWLCFKEKLDVGDIVIPISDYVRKEFLFKPLIIIRIEKNESETNLYMIRFEDFKKFVDHESYTEIHGTEDLIEKIGTWM